MNLAHNLVHLLSGLGALACGFAGEKPARLFCLGFGAVYGLVAILGLLRVPFVVDLLHLNTPDDILHVAIAAVFLGAGLMSKPGPASTSPPVGA